MLQSARDSPQFAALDAAFERASEASAAPPAAAADALVRLARAREGLAALGEVGGGGGGSLKSKRKANLRFGKPDFTYTTIIPERWSLS